MNDFVAIVKYIVVSLLIIGLVQLIAFLGDAKTDPFVGNDSEFSILQTVGVLSVAIQILVFIPSYLFQSERFFDLTGSATYLALILYSFFAGAELNFDKYTDRAILVTVLVCIWCARLGIFLFIRVLKTGKDGRFDEIKPNFFRFLNVWILQALWVMVTAFAAFIVNSDQFENGDLDSLAYAGLAVWIVGFVIEFVADSQKQYWRASNNKQHKFIDYGLWNYSRHPNYFGEMTLWLGIFLISIPSLDGRQYSAVISPIFVFCLIYFVSGVPLLEKRSDEKFKDDAAYWEYKKNTSVLVPLPKGTQIPFCK